MLYDTLVDRLEEDEIVAIVGIELAHAKHNRCVLVFPILMLLVVMVVR